MRTLHFALALAAVSGIVTAGQQPADPLIAAVRTALGGDAVITDVRTLALGGQATITAGGRNMTQRVERLVERPDKCVVREQFSGLTGQPYWRTRGIAGSALVNVTDRSADGAQRLVRRPGRESAAPSEPDPAEQARALAAARHDCVRLLLGLVGDPLGFTTVALAPAERAESGGQTADVIAITGPDDFSARLFIDRDTRLPLLVAWMDKEPLVLPPAPQQMTREFAEAFARGLTDEETERFRKERDARIREAEARRRTVEYRLYFSERREVERLRLPARLVLTIDGEEVERVVFERFTVNETIRPERFTGRR